MILEDVVKEITVEYIKWHKEGTSKVPTEKSLETFGKVLYDCMNQAYNSGNGILTFKGTDTGRKAIIGFVLHENICKVAAWEKTYTMPITELAKAQKQDIEYDKKTKPVWIRTLKISPEAEEFVKGVYKSCMSPDEEVPEILKESNPQTTLDENL